MKQLDIYLKEFRGAMMQAFVEAAPKHENEDVRNDETDWTKFDIGELKKHIFAHVLAFIDPKLTEEEKLNELVDIANYAFVMYIVIQLKRKKEE